MALLLALIPVAVVVIGGIVTLITLRAKSDNQRKRDRTKTLQANRDRAAERFRLLMTEIITTADAMSARAQRADGNVATDFQAFGPQFAGYVSRLNAEGCTPLADDLATVAEKATEYGFSEHHHYTARMSGNLQAVTNTWSACDAAFADLRAALTTLTDGLREHMKLLETPVA